MDTGGVFTELGKAGQMDLREKMDSVWVNETEVSLGHPSKDVQQTKADTLFCTWARAEDREFRIISL